METTTTEPLTTQAAPDGRAHNRGTVGNAGGVGGPVGNAHRLTHGAYSYLATGRLPKGASYIRRNLAKLKGALESAVQDKHGQVSLNHALSINAAVRHEARAQLASRYLRLDAEEVRETQTQAKVIDGVRVAKSPTRPPRGMRPWIVSGWTKRAAGRVPGTRSTPGRLSPR